MRGMGVKYMNIKGPLLQSPTNCQSLVEKVAVTKDVTSHGVTVEGCHGRIFEEDEAAKSVRFLLLSTLICPDSMLEDPSAPSSTALSALGFFWGGFSAPPKLPEQDICA